MKLRLLHSDRAFASGRGKLSYVYWVQQTNERIIESLRPSVENRECLRVRLSDDVVMQGNTRIKILIERGYNVDELPFEPYF